MDELHPALRYETSVRTLRHRATATFLGLLLSALPRAGDAVGRQVTLHLFDGGATEPELESAERFVNACYAVTPFVSVATAILFLLWVHRLVKLTRSLDGQMLRWKPSQAVWGFLIPFLNLFRPYQVLRDVQRQLEIRELPEPLPEPRRDGSSTYREMSFDAPPPAKRLTNGLLGAWWGFDVAFQVTNSLSSKLPVATVAQYHRAAYSGTAVDVLAIVGAILGVRVVLSLTARLEERFRRIRHMPREQLEANAIVLS